jgi:regulator of protease activity HflC (stomatin/prohibitin superfamily)
MQPNEILHVLDEVVEFVEGAVKSSNVYEAKLAAMAKRMAESEQQQSKVVLEKVAQARADVLNEAAMRQALSKLSGMGVMQKEACARLEAQIKNDPNVVFALMVKVAEHLLSEPGEGVGVQREDPISNDPDGWDLVGTGKLVPMRR